jgi:hypothetical protein
MTNLDFLRDHPPIVRPARRDPKPRLRDVDCNTPEMFRIDIKTGRVLVDRRKEVLRCVD